MSIFNYKQRNNIILASIIILGCFLVYALSGLFSSILGAIVLFTIFRPVFLYLTEKRRWNKTLVTLLIIFTSLIVIVIPFLSLSIMVVGKISGLNRNSLPIQEWIYKIDMFAGSHLNQPKLAENTLQKLGVYVTGLFPSIIRQCHKHCFNLAGNVFPDVFYVYPNAAVRGRPVKICTLPRAACTKICANASQCNL